MPCEGTPTPTLSLAFDALRIEVREDRIGIVRLLEPVVADFIVDTPERWLIVVRRRVQSLHTAEFGDLTLDQPVVVSALVRGGNYIPESKVDIELVRLQRAQIISAIRDLEGTHPYRQDRDLPKQELAEFRAARDGNVDIQIGRA